MSTKKQLNIIVNNKQRNWIFNFLYYSCWRWRCFHSINCNNDIAFRDIYYLLCWGWERTCTLWCVLCTRLTEYGRPRWHVLVMSSAITDNCVHLWLDSRQCNYISTYRHTVTVCVSLVSATNMTLSRTKQERSANCFVHSWQPQGWGPPKIFCRKPFEDQPA